MVIISISRLMIVGSNYVDLALVALLLYTFHYFKLWALKWTQRYTQRLPR